MLLQPSSQFPSGRTRYFLGRVSGKLLHMLCCLCLSFNRRDLQVIAECHPWDCTAYSHGMGRGSSADGRRSGRQALHWSTFLAPHCAGRQPSVHCAANGSRNAEGKCASPLIVHPLTANVEGRGDWSDEESKHDLRLLAFTPAGVYHRPFCLFASSIFSYLVDDARKRDIHVIAWTVNDPYQASFLRLINVRSLFAYCHAVRRKM